MIKIAHHIKIWIIVSHVIHQFTRLICAPKLCNFSSTRFIATINMVYTDQPVFPLQPAQQEQRENEARKSVAITGAAAVFHACHHRIMPIDLNVGTHT